MTWMTIPDYAEHRGLSSRMIRKHITTGRIPKKATRPKKKGGKHLLVHMEKADKALSENLKIPSEKTILPSKPTAEEMNRVIDEAGIERCRSLTDAQRLDKEYAAALKKLDHAERSGILVSAVEVSKACFDAGRLARDAILNIPERISAILASMSDPYSAQLN